MRNSQCLNGTLQSGTQGGNPLHQCPVACEGLLQSYCLAGVQFKRMNGLSLLTFKVQYARLPSSRVTVNSFSGLVGEQAAGSPRSGDVSACTSMSGPEGMASARPRAGPTGCADDIAGLCKGAATAGTLPTCRCSVVSIGPELKTAPCKGELQL